MRTYTCTRKWNTTLKTRTKWGHFFNFLSKSHSKFMMGKAFYRLYPFFINDISPNDTDMQKKKKWLATSVLSVFNYGKTQILAHRQNLRLGVLQCKKRRPHYQPTQPQPLYRRLPTGWLPEARKANTGLHSAQTIYNLITLRQGHWSIHTQWN